MRSPRFLPRAIAVAAASALVLAGATGAGANPTSDPKPGRGSDVRQTGTDYNKGKPLKVSKADSKVVPADPTQPVKVGQTRSWLALDDYQGSIYLKPYKLAGMGENIEIWVAKDLAFPRGDCRNTVDKGALVTVTPAQVASFIKEFDTNMYPKESEAFSTAPPRDGSNAWLAKNYNGLPRTQFRGDGDNTVVLVDNVRDANYYDPTSPDGQTYIAGFFYSVFNEYVDRNVMTIDSYDWLHRTGATPPDDTKDPAYMACAKKIDASVLGRSNPYLYEGTFAHEYQHLLEYYADTDEVSWVNEGLSDWAQTLTGYVDPNYLPTSDMADSHIACFQGYLPESYGGPENSLTMWGDQGGPEILCDYGAAYTFFEYLHGRFDGNDFMSALHTEPANGLAGLQAVLDDFGHNILAQDVIHDWLAMVALDNAIDEGAEGAGDVFTSPTLKSMVDWDNPQAYDSPGAPPNGGDFVKLPGSGTLTFVGEAAYPKAPVEWTVDGGRLFSGAGDDLDRAIVYSVEVPAEPGDQTLAVTMEWGTELGWDFAFVQVWDSATKTWESQPDEQGFATSVTDPGAIPSVVDNLPGFTGPGANGDVLSGPQNLTFDLSAYAGQTIDLAFRYITDPAATGLGFWVDRARIGGVDITDGSSLVGAQSLTEAHPVPVARWTVQVVGYGGTISSHAEVPVTQQPDGTWTGTLAVPTLGTTGAIVTADDPEENAPGYPEYTLSVD